MERFRDFVKVVATLSAKEFLEQFPHPLLFYSEVPHAMDAFIHTRLMSGSASQQIDRFSDQVLDFIALLPNPRTGRDFPDKAFIGRDAKRDYVIQHSTVSNRHACLMYDREKEVYKLIDSGSTNGTMVRGKDVVPGDPIAVYDGDVITFGRLNFLFFSPKGAYRYMRQYRKFNKAMQED